ncbi:hypothetical protein LC065_11505 [Halobacillus litoralis]|uniref:hypothetical protein n=1 Tax=Halobacillus litoralis TaxID=45668 RepID=UPI001CFEA893|nr:hypothetical protein [Halobacillus litoralis]WLR46227.1 hypothetical protein LC065_11505 [Halobacillus litoralis]
MGDLIELIFSNFLILAAIIGGIISWFSGMTKENENKHKPEKKTSPIPPAYPSGPSRDLQETETKDKSGEERLRDYYETKQKKLAEAETAHAEDRQREDEEMHPHMAPSRKKQKVSSELNLNGPLIEKTRKWDRKRLAEGILMAEVLGPPRARKPHSSHPRKR